MPRKSFHLTNERRNNYLEDCGHLLLLGEGAVVLDGEDDGEGRGYERRLGDCLHDISERDLGRQRVAVVDDRLQLWAR